MLVPVELTVHHKFPEQEKHGLKIPVVEKNLKFAVIEESQHLKPPVKAKYHFNFSLIMTSYHHCCWEYSFLDYQTRIHSLL